MQRTLKSKLSIHAEKKNTKKIMLNNGEKKWREIIIWNIQ